MTATHVVLVDENDQPIGTQDKLSAHQQGACHRAFSVFVFRDHPTHGRELLLQQRALDKYHSGGYWTNTCCSHPHPDEKIVTAGERRLYEEMGIQLTLHTVGRFHYIAHFDNGLIENEIDHVLIGTLAPGDATFQPNAAEVHDWRWVSLDALNIELTQHPEHFTPWFAEALAISLAPRHA